jgi:3-hydroxy-9,10-secoandrosta-1,3,5(10)-triene-9,17-dione monooxygenase reductase component
MAFLSSLGPITIHQSPKFLSPSLRKLDLHATNPTRFRAAMGLFTTGVAVITTAWNDTYHGMTANSLTSVSLDPCLLLICSRRGSLTGEAIKQRGAFAVNLLANEQSNISRRFVGKIDERFKDLDVKLDTLGLPLLPESLAHFSCVVHNVHPGGDHDIVVGEVAACSVGEGEPLLFYRGGVGRHRLQALS